MTRDTVRRPGLDTRLTVFAVPVFAVLVGLGWWQLERLEWKEQLIATRAAAYASQPVPLEDVSVEHWRDREHSRVKLRGHYLHDREMLLQNRQHNGRTGYGLITPMQLEEGGSVLVDRGWIPRTVTTIERPEGAIEETGILRGGSRPNRWVPDNEAASGLWFYMDVVQMGAAARLADPAPYFVRILPAGTGNPVYPRPAPGLGRLPNRHLEYALTWFGLAVVMVVIYVLYHLRRSG